jgi:hypothetical protein
MRVLRVVMTVAAAVVLGSGAATAASAVPPGPGQVPMCPSPGPDIVLPCVYPPKPAPTDPGA